jgi:hypothetical protein
MSSRIRIWGRKQIAELQIFQNAPVTPPDRKRYSIHQHFFSCIGFYLAYRNDIGTMNAFEEM